MRFDLIEPLLLLLTLLLLVTGIAVLSKDEVEGNVPKKSDQSVLAYLYPKDYTRPTMKEALAETGLTEKQVEIIFNVCESFQMNGGCLKGILRMQLRWPCTPTTLGPRTLRATRTGSSTGRTLLKCRGERAAVSCDERTEEATEGDREDAVQGCEGRSESGQGPLSQGDVVTWSALSSTSPDMEATKAFLGKGSKSGNATGTLFIIDKGWGYDIQPYSLFPDEEEILLEPERQFRVVSVLKAALTIINLEMLDTPLSVPEVFREWCRWKKERSTVSLFFNFFSFSRKIICFHKLKTRQDWENYFCEMFEFLDIRPFYETNNKDPLSGHLHYRCCCSDDLPSTRCCCSRQWSYWR